MVHVVVETFLHRITPQGARYQATAQRIVPSTPAGLAPILSIDDCGSRLSGGYVSTSLLLLTEELAEKGITLSGAWDRAPVVG